MEALYAGPWSWDGCYPIRIVDYAGYIVCEGIMPARYRDARLITAAPELLHELRDLAEKAHNVMHVPASVWDAIAKATGTTHD